MFPFRENHNAHLFFEFFSFNLQRGVYQHFMHDHNYFLMRYKVYKFGRLKSSEYFGRGGWGDARHNGYRNFCNRSIWMSSVKIFFDKVDFWREKIVYGL